MDFDMTNDQNYTKDFEEKNTVVKWSDENNMGFSNLAYCGMVAVTSFFQGAFVGTLIGVFAEMNKSGNHMLSICLISFKI